MIVTRIKAWLSARKIEAAKAERLRAWEELNAAKKSRDTRLINVKQKAMDRATEYKLRLELQCSSRDHARSLGGVR